MYKRNIWLYYLHHYSLTRENPVHGYKQCTLWYSVKVSHPANQRNRDACYSFTVLPFTGFGFNQEINIYFQLWLATIKQINVVVTRVIVLHCWHFLDSFSTKKYIYVFNCDWSRVINTTSMVELYTTIPYYHLQTCKPRLIFH